MASLSKKVLITGINGFTGKYLTEFLQKKGFQVFGISNHNDEANPDVIQCDINDLSQLTAVFEKIRPNYILHLAAISFVGHDDLSEIYKVNVLGTQNLLDACVSVKETIEKVILASSATVYGNQQIEVLSETVAPEPVNHYGISKLAMEFMARNYFNRLPIIITRPFNYTAPGHGEQFVVPKIAKAFREKAEVLELGNLEVYREYNSIDFVCGVYTALMLSDAKSEIVNIASGQTHSLQSIIDLFSQKSGHRPEIKVNPAFVRKDEIKTLAGDTAKLKSMIALPYAPPIEDTIDRFLSE